MRLGIGLNVFPFEDGGDTEAPAAPEDFLLCGVDDGVVILEWTANSEEDLDHYNLYRSTTPGFTPEPGTLLAAIAAGTETYTDDDGGGGLTNGTAYYYRLSAVDASENESPFADEVEAIPLLIVVIPQTGGPPSWVHDGIPNGQQRRAKVTSKKAGGGLSAPTNLVGLAGDGKIIWAWDEDASAEEYVVYETDAETLEVTPGKDESAVSNEATATPGVGPFSLGDMLSADAAPDYVILPAGTSRTYVLTPDPNSPVGVSWKPFSEVV